MGKKYIIELPENTHWIQWLMEGTEDHHPYMDFKSVEDLTPYTEPDLDHVREEAYEQGYHDGHNVCYENAKDIMEEKKKEAYQCGLADAWEAARKIVKMPDRDFINSDILDLDPGESIFTKYTASEAIEKIRQYEQEQEYRVGDEFEIGDGQKFIVLKMDGKEIDRYIDGDGKTYVMKEKYRVMRKTGRHFPEIATVLEKMRGEKE
jgi:hypothetical protein